MVCCANLLGEAVGLILTVCICLALKKLSIKLRIRDILFLTNQDMVNVK